ncbi:MAG: hypothetical protein R2932_60690 [Caldilineaceae bacterium]
MRQPLTHGCSTVSQRATENFGLSEIEVEGTLPVGHVRLNIDHPSRDCTTKWGMNLGLGE